MAPLFGNELPIAGVIALSQGAILVSMIWAAVSAWIFDRRFLDAALWMAAGSVLSFFGLMHAYTLSPMGVENKLGLFAVPAFTLKLCRRGVVSGGLPLLRPQVSNPWIGAGIEE